MGMIGRGEQVAWGMFPKCHPRTVAITVEYYAAFKRKSHHQL